MIAYPILAHHLPGQLRRMFRAIHVPENRYLTHADQRSGYLQIPSAKGLPAEIYDHVRVAYPRELAPRQFKAGEPA